MYDPGPGIEFFHFISVPAVVNLLDLKLKVFVLLLNLFGSITLKIFGSYVPGPG